MYVYVCMCVYVYGYAYKILMIKAPKVLNRRILCDYVSKRKYNLVCNVEFRA